jgi:hypothetical protein
MTRLPSAGVCSPQAQQEKERHQQQEKRHPQKQQQQMAAQLRLQLQGLLPRPAAAMQPGLLQWWWVALLSQR